VTRARPADKGNLSGSPFQTRKGTRWKLPQFSQPGNKQSPRTRRSQSVTVPQGLPGGRFDQSQFRRAPPGNDSPVWRPGDKAAQTPSFWVAPRFENRDPARRSQYSRSLRAQEGPANNLRALSEGSPDCAPVASSVLQPAPILGRPERGVTHPGPAMNHARRAHPINCLEPDQRK
jgi:hypothetical protein